MRKAWYPISLMLVCIICGMGAGHDASAGPNPSRAVSLNALCAAMKANGPTADAKNLCGITKLCGYIIDADSKDIVLLGVVDPNLPALNLDDLVIALRNTRGAYNHIRGRVQYYSDPGCSIDPNPMVIAQLRDLHLPVGPEPQDLQSRSEAWKRIGSQPQKVRVMGVPFDSHFAQVMVDADYYMKRIVNGTVALGISGLTSLSDLDIERRRQLMISGRSASLYGGSMNRFWFSPGESTYEVRDGAVLLRSCEVKLLTEEEFLTEQGVLSEMGRPNPAADVFARCFTDKYDQIAAARPIYKQLRGLFVMVAVARLMKEERADKSGSASLAYLMRDYPVSTAPVSRLVNGLTDIRHINETVNTPHGPAQLSLVQSTCGGVSMGVRPRKIRTRTETPIIVAATQPHLRNTAATSAHRVPIITPRAAARSESRIAKTHVSIKAAVLTAKKSHGALSWDVPIQLDW